MIAIFAMILHDFDVQAAASLRLSPTTVQSKSALELNPGGQRGPLSIPKGKTSMTNTADRNGRRVADAKPPAPTPPTPLTLSLPKGWNDIKVGSLVIGHETKELGWWEAIVTEAKGELFTLRWRDYPTQPTVVRSRQQIALLFTGS
jgi:hypothetical protein